MLNTVSAIPSLWAGTQPPRYSTPSCMYLSKVTLCFLAFTLQTIWSTNWTDIGCVTQMKMTLLSFCNPDIPWVQILGIWPKNEPTNLNKKLGLQMCTLNAQKKDWKNCQIFEISKDCFKYDDICHISCEGTKIAYAVFSKTYCWLLIANF